MVKEADSLLEGHPSRFIRIDLGDKSVVRVELIMVKNRLYYIEIIVPKGREGVMGAENDYEEIATSFLNSFKLT